MSIAATHASSSEKLGRRGKKWAISTCISYQSSGAYDTLKIIVAVG